MSIDQPLLEGDLVDPNFCISADADLPLPEWTRPAKPKQVFAVRFSSRGEDTTVLGLPPVREARCSTTFGRST